MPLRFAIVCSLLDKLEANSFHYSLPKDRNTEQLHIIDVWFQAHRRDIDDRDTDGQALLSCLLPQRRTDRVYGLQEASLSRVLARCLHLSSAKTKALQLWNLPGNNGLGACLENIMKIHDSDPKPPGIVTAEWVDSVLQTLAARCRFSSPEVRASAKDSSCSNPSDALEPIYALLSSSEAKWMTRLILKDLAPVVLDENLIFTHYHFLLPGLLKFQDSLGAALTLLRGPLGRYHSNPDPKSRAIFIQDAAQFVVPRIGVKVGRPPFLKARSLSHCIDMTRAKRWIVERKYDGEYCEVHVDLGNAENPLRIFSKSGKDSTRDRSGIHSTIREALRLGSSDCPVKKQCILLGELLVYREKTQSILEFHHLRRHIYRSGKLIGVEQDSFPEDGDHLMIVFFDVLLLDDEITLRLPHHERRQRLKTIIEKKPGYVMTSEWRIVDFSKRDSPKVLAYQFIDALARRSEGLVLKPADSPYCSFAPFDNQRMGYFIKVKKDYMNDLEGDRDHADFAIIGASFDPKSAAKSSGRHVKYTDFYLGCLTNPKAGWGQVPNYEVVGSINCANGCIPLIDFQDLNNLGQFRAVSERDAVTFTWQGASFNKITTLFSSPIVVEVLGSGFVKPPGCSFYMLRHARILRLHLDREWTDAVTFSDLQTMAEKARSEPSQGESQEMADVYSKIKSRYNAKRARERLSQLSSVSPVRTPSQISEKTVSPGSTSSVRTVIVVNSLSKTPSLVRVDTLERRPGESAHEVFAQSPLGGMQMSQDSSRAMQQMPFGKLLEPIGGNKMGPLDPTAAKRETKEFGGQVPNGQHNTFEHDLRQTKKRRVDVTCQSCPMVLEHFGRASPGLDQTGSAVQLKRTDSAMHIYKGRKDQVVVDKTMSRPSTTTILHQPPAMSHSSSSLSGSRAFNSRQPGCEQGKCSVSAHSPLTCLMSNWVVYLTSSIGYKGDIERILFRHGAVVVSNIAAWERETFPMMCPTTIMSESPAYPGMIKTILVDFDEDKVDTGGDSAGQLMTKDVRERVLWFDCRVVKRLDEAERGNNVDEKALEVILEHHHEGISYWDADAGRVTYADWETKPWEAGWIMSG
jgi:DNA ligase-4